MGSLADKKIGDSFKDLLHISNDNNGIDGAVRFITDGGGTQSVLGLNASGITIDGHILPTTNAAFDIGSANNKIRHLFLSDNSLYVGDVQLSSDDAANVKSLGDGIFATAEALNTGMTSKADVDYVDQQNSTMTSALDSKADQSAVNTALDSKADQSALASKADQSALDSKADQSALDSKADQSAVNTALASKADQSALDSKADVDYVDQQNLTMAGVVNSKADQSAVNTALAGKADIGDIPTLTWTNGILYITNT